MPFLNELTQQLHSIRQACGTQAKLSVAWSAYAAAALFYHLAQTKNRVNRATGFTIVPLEDLIEEQTAAKGYARTRETLGQMLQANGFRRSSVFFAETDETHVYDLFAPQI